MQPDPGNLSPGVRHPLRGFLGSHIDRSKVKEIVDRELPKLAETLHVGHWRINARYDWNKLNDPHNHSAECGRSLPYCKATIYFEPDSFDDETEVIETLRHELLHVVLSPFDVLHTLLIETLEGLPRKQADAVWHFSIEQAIFTLENVLMSLGVGPGKDTSVAMDARVGVPPSGGDAPDAIC